MIYVFLVPNLYSKIYIVNTFFLLLLCTYAHIPMLKQVVLHVCHIMKVLCTSVCEIVFCTQVDFNETGLLITEPYFNFTSITEAMTEMFFEEYQFQSIYKCNRKLPIINIKHEGLLCRGSCCFVVCTTCIR